MDELTIKKWLIGNLKQLCHLNMDTVTDVDMVSCFIKKELDYCFT